MSDPQPYTERQLYDLTVETGRQKRETIGLVVYKFLDWYRFPRFCLGSDSIHVGELHRTGRAALLHYLPALTKFTNLNGFLILVSGSSSLLRLMHSTT